MTYTGREHPGCLRLNTISILKRHIAGNQCVLHSPKHLGFSLAAIEVASALNCCWHHTVLKVSAYHVQWRPTSGPAITSKPDMQSRVSTAAPSSAKGRYLPKLAAHVLPSIRSPWADSGRFRIHSCRGSAKRSVVRPQWHFEFRGIL